MGFYAKLLERRRLALMLLSLMAGHLLLWVLAIYAIIEYQQFWLLATVLWLLLIIPTFRKINEWLQAIFASRHADVLATSGLTTEDASDQAGKVLTNVCEEIAIATGNPQPQVAICQSEGINAFLSVPDGSRGGAPAIVFTSAMAESLDRNELQAVAAGLYAHRRGFDRMFFTMAGAMYLGAFIAADFFLILVTIVLYFSSTFESGPLAVPLSVGMIAAPAGVARFAQVRAMRRTRFLDDLGAIEITNNPDSMKKALEKTGGAAVLLEATYDIENAHFYFNSVNDASKKYPWQRLATHPTPAARAKAVGEFA